MQAFAWCAVFVLSVLIVASRKHYTVDVLIAWYVVPLVFYAMLRRWTTKRPVNEEPWPHRSLAEDNALQLEEVVVHGNIAAPEVGLEPCSSGTTPPTPPKVRPGAAVCTAFIGGLYLITKCPPFPNSLCYIAVWLPLRWSRLEAMHCPKPTELRVC